MLEIDGLDVRYGVVAAVRGRLARGARRRDRRADRAERRRQVDDAARDHGARAAVARGEIRLHGRRSSGGLPPERVARSGSRARAGGTPDLRRADGRGEPPARPRRAALARRVPRGPRRGLRAVPDRRRVPASRRRRSSPAASSSSSRSAVRSSPAPICSSSTSPRSGWRRRSSTSCSRRSRRSATAALTVLLVEQRAQRTVALADRTYLISQR